ncbi:MAG: hypothetical protein KC635_11580, partial [Myxococcales bacterium]|nr:hypothetical protein [Myxococcales bacterium]
EDRDGFDDEDGCPDDDRDGDVALAFGVGGDEAQNAPRRETVSGGDLRDGDGAEVVVDSKRGYLIPAQDGQVASGEHTVVATDKIENRPVDAPPPPDETGGEVALGDRMGPAGGRVAQPDTGVLAQRESKEEKKSGLDDGKLAGTDGIAAGERFENGDDVAHGGLVDLDSGDDGRFTTTVVTNGTPAGAAGTTEPALAQRVAGQDLWWSRDLKTPVAPRPALDALTFVPARGYFENTYHPGDGELAWLREAVMGGIARDGRRVALDELAEPVKQPFDRPRDAALAVVLASDTPAVDGPARVTLQVGLAAAEQAPARRAPLNLGIVVDVAGVVGDEERRALWSAAEAVAADRQAGDRLVVVAVTAAGPRVLAAEDATGPAAVTRFLADALVESSGGGGDVSGAVTRAYALVRGAMREDAAVGENAVVLMTPRDLDDAGVRALLEVAHGQAVGGVHLSTVGIGGRVDGAELTALAAAGQGRRHVAARPDEARKVVGEELAAAGRAVARAVRLRIRLAEGVKLVGVVGSRRLDEVDASKVRAAEKAIDQRVAATTGIAADRGEDEDG